MVLISKNMPIVRKSQLEYFSMIGNVKAVPYTGNNVELGSACGKLFRVGCMCIIEPGDSDILEKNSK
jgi:large subunit ribosomal protein L30e